MIFEDCPICLDEMHHADAKHPLQCQRHCGYNFCRNCIESLISSSKDDYMEASDGSRQVKVWLHCPSCRSDLTHSIRDTLLLRKVDELLYLLDVDQKGATLTDAQVRLKDALKRSENVKAAIVESRRREADYLGTAFIEEEDISEVSSIEEMGVEADLLSGVHDSIRWPKSPVLSIEEGSQAAETQIDTILFGGLDYFLNDCDRVYLTELMTSGKPESLVEAAQVLATVAKMIRDPQQAAAKEAPELLTKPKNRNLVKRSSVFALVAEVKEVHRDEAKKENGDLPFILKGTGVPRRSSSAQHTIKTVEHKKLFPLPVRMPKYIEVHPAALNQMRLVHHDWDGTVMDAYSKITVGFNQRVTQRKSSHRGVRNILGDGEARIELPGQQRLLLASVPREMGNQGAAKGDVLTHIQGKNVSGMTKQEVGDLLLNTSPNSNGRSVFVLNAERSVAEALKRRAIAIAEPTR